MPDLYLPGPVEQSKVQPFVLHSVGDKKVGRLPLYKHTISICRQIHIYYIHFQYKRRHIQMSQSIGTGTALVAVLPFYL